MTDPRLVALALEVADELDAPGAGAHTLGLGAGLLRRLARELVARLMDGRSDIRNPAAYRRKLKRTVLAEHAPDLVDRLEEHPTWSASQVVDEILGRPLDATEDPAVAKARRLDAARAHGANVGANVPDDELDDVLAAYSDPAARAAFRQGRVERLAGAVT